jgi:hypothetical protein
MLGSQNPSKSDRLLAVTGLHTTVMTATGISPKIEFNIEGRPFYVTEDGKGKAVTDIFV